MKSYKLIIFILLFFGLNACSNKESCVELNTEKVVVPKTTKQPEPINSYTPDRIAHLTKIVIALEKYKLTNNHYPISKNSGKEWNALINLDLSVDSDWIPGLAPTYIDQLPRDPRNNDLHENQYLYKSNGAHFKLIATRPDDCKMVRTKTPEVIDPRRSCKAYGFWTEGAVRW